MDKNIASNWDLYLITILTVLLGLVFYFRRPPVPVNEHRTPTHSTNSEAQSHETQHTSDSNQENQNNLPQSQSSSTESQSQPQQQQTAQNDSVLNQD